MDYLQIYDDLAPGDRVRVQWGNGYFHSGTFREIVKCRSGNYALSLSRASGSLLPLMPTKKINHIERLATAESHRD